jgi:hypothetical protein
MLARRAQLVNLFDVRMEQLEAHVILYGTFLLVLDTELYKYIH